MLQPLGLQIRANWEYKVFRKFVKIVQQEIIYLGFPQTVFEELKNEVSKDKIITKENYIQLKGIL